MAKNVEIDGPRVSFTVEFKSASYPFKEKVLANAKAAVMTISGVGIVTVNSAAVTEKWTWSSAYAGTARRGVVPDNANIPILMT